VSYRKAKMRSASGDIEQERTGESISIYGRLQNKHMLASVGEILSPVILEKPGGDEVKMKYTDVY